MFFYYDPTYILVIIGAVICMAASRMSTVPIEDMHRCGAGPV